VGWLIIALSLLVVCDAVIARGILSTSIIWAYDITYMLCGGAFMLGGAYILRMGGHIRIDFLQERFSPRIKAIIELVFYLVVFFPLVVVMIKYSAGWAWDSWYYRERTLIERSIWQGPVYPFKTVLPIGFVLLGVQGVAEFIRNLRVALRGTADEP